MFQDIMIKLLFALIAIAGYVANIKDYKKISYILWTISNYYWLMYNFSIKEYQMAFMFSIYTAFCLWGLINTKR